MPDERRQAGRCPICQGPTTEDATIPGGRRCRRSVCIHNHQDVACPRCRKKSLESVAYMGTKFVYTCSDCKYLWQEDPAAP